MSVTFLLLSFLGSLFGGWLIGQWAVGLVVLAYSLLLGAFARLRDDGKPAQPLRAAVHTLDEVLDRARRAA